MSLDVSAKAIGLSKSDSSRLIASPFHAFYRKHWKNDRQTLSHIFQQNKISGLILGWPLTPRGKQASRCQSIQDFIQSLSPTVPVCLWDERFSTQHVPYHTAANQKSTKLWDNAIAASIILNRFLYWYSFNSK